MKPCAPVSTPRICSTVALAGSGKVGAAGSLQVAPCAKAGSTPAPARNAANIIFFNIRMKLLVTPEAGVKHRILGLRSRGACGFHAPNIAGSSCCDFPTVPFGQEPVQETGQQSQHQEADAEAVEHVGTMGPGNMREPAH